MNRQEEQQALHAEIDRIKGKLQALRDEMRVRLHLVGLDAKQEWSKLEPELEALERGARAATEASRKALLAGLRRAERVLEGSRNQPRS